MKGYLKKSWSINLVKYGILEDLGRDGNRLELRIRNRQECLNPQSEAENSSWIKSYYLQSDLATK